MKKLSLKAKKTIIYVVTVVLIVALISGVILSLGVVRAVADENERVNLLNSIMYLDIDTDFSSVPVDDYSNVSSRMAGNIWLKPNEPSWVGIPTYHTGTLKNWIDFPSFYFYPDDFKINNLSSTTAIYIYYALVLKSDVEQITPISYFLTYNVTSSGASSTTTLVSYTSTEYTILIHAIGQYTNKVTSRVDINELRYEFPVAGNTLTFDVVGGVVGTSVADVINNAIAIRDDDIAANPHDVVFGTDELVKSYPSDTQTMYFASDILFPWDNGYIGVVGRVKTADGVSIPVMYSARVDGLLQNGDGTWIILDPNYHDYIIPFEIYGGQQNPGYVDITVDNAMEVVYLAVSDNFDLLSADLVDKVNKYQLIQDEINAAYGDGYLAGYELGLKKALAGVFGNAQLSVDFAVYNPVNGSDTLLSYDMPLNVANGGLDFSFVWDLWSDNAANDGTNVLTDIIFNIHFDTGFLWSNDLLYFKFNTPVVANQLPYDAYLITIEQSSQDFVVNFVERNGLWYWNASNLDGYSVSDLTFKINNQHISYYNFLTGYNTTLNNNIQTFGTNQASYDRGFDDGFIDGVDEGYSDGIAQSSQVSWMEGHSAGYDEGRNVGYNVGYEDGLRDDYRFYDLFFSLFDAELNVFKSIVSFEIFGVNVAGFVLGLVTIGVVAFVIRKVW